MSNELMGYGLTTETRKSVGPRLLGAFLAVIITASIFGGYAYLRKRHAQQIIPPPVTTPTDSTPKGPPRAQVIIDEPLLKGTETIIAGQVKNISNQTLMDLSVRFELRRRKDNSPVETLISIEPPTLEANGEGAYAGKFPARDYASVRLLGLVSGSSTSTSQISYVSTQGKQRPPERIEPKTIVITKPSSKGEFLNSPDNPARVP